MDIKDHLQFDIPVGRWNTWELKSYKDDRTIEP